MANVWPVADSFPQYPLVTPTAESDPDVTIRTPVDVGPAKLRCRSTAGSEPHQYAFHLTVVNKAAMKVFYQTTCTFGSEAYEWDHPETAVTETWRFMKPPEYRKVGPDAYICTVELEMLP